MQTSDLNAISAGRIDRIWLPLLADIERHPLMGQGLNAILWTDAQREQLIIPVVLSHNGYLDLLLDFGIPGAIASARGLCIPLARLPPAFEEDPDPRLRGLFYGAHLALVAFSLDLRGEREDHAHRHDLAHLDGRGRDDRAHVLASARRPRCPRAAAGFL